MKNKLRLAMIATSLLAGTSWAAFAQTNPAASPPATGSGSPSYGTTAPLAPGNSGPMTAPNGSAGVQPGDNSGMSGYGSSSPGTASPDTGGAGGSSNYGTMTSPGASDTGTGAGAGSDNTTGHPPRYAAGRGRPDPSQPAPAADTFPSRGSRPGASGQALAPPHSAAAGCGRVKLRASCAMAAAAGRSISPAPFSPASCTVG